jgi:ABC-type antimicrobial peptide transport system permease subunit
MGTLTRATKNLSRRKVRALIVIIALSLALTLLIVLPPSINANQTTTQRTINTLTNNANLINSTVSLAATEIDCSLGTNFTFTPSTDNSTITVAIITANITDYSGLSAIPDVTAVIPILQQYGIVKYGILNGVPLDSASLLESYPSILPANITEGRTLQAGDSGMAIVQERLAKVYNVTVGSTLTLSGQNFQVVGIEGQEALNSTTITMSLSDAQATANMTGQASEFKIFVDGIGNVNTVSTRIKSLYPKLQVSDGLSQLNSAQEILTNIDEQVQAAQNNLNQTQGTGLIEISIAVIADTAIILFIMLYSVRERTKEIGTLKAMGASNATILGQFMLEGVLLSLIAALVAIAIGVFVAPTLANLLLPHSIESGTIGASGFSFEQNPGGSSAIAVPITPEVMLLGLSAALLLGALGSLYPALKAARTKPAEAMRYE